MVWTEPPRDWTDGEFVIETMMDTHVRDQFKATWHEIKKKASTQSVTSSTTLVDCTDMAITVAASEVWAFQFRVIHDGASAGDLKTAFTFPASGDLQAMGIGMNTTDATALVVGRYSTTTSPTASVTYGCNAANDWQMLSVEGVFINSTTPGTLQFQFAQVTSNATATRVKANSQVLGMKLA